MRLLGGCLPPNPKQDSSEVGGPEQFPEDVGSSRTSIEVLHLAKGLAKGHEGFSNKFQGFKISYYNKEALVFTRVMVATQFPLTAAE